VILDILKNFDIELLLLTVCLVQGLLRQMICDLFSDSAVQ